jgi:hypothetical protein
MTLWKMERRAPLSTLDAPARKLGEAAALVAVAAALGLVLVWLISLPLVLPVLGLASFMIACAAALFAHCSGADRRAPGTTAWHIAAIFASIWVVAGMMSDPTHIVEFFEHLTMAP